MRQLLLNILVTGLIPLLSLTAQDKPKELLAAVLSAKGECYYERAGRAEMARVKTIFFKNDRIYTRDGKMDVQIGPSAVLHLAPYTTVVMTDLTELNAKSNIMLELETGRGYTKFSKQMTPGSKYTIKSPTLVAGVRGTEFIISAGDVQDAKAEDADIPSGVFVNHGKVAVRAASSEGDDQEIPAGEQITNVDNALVKGVMEDFIKKKMALFKKMEAMKEFQYKTLERAKQQQIEALERVREGRNFNNPGNSIDEMRRKQSEHFNK
ncbi:MAG: FecR domain-containing protein [Spirochaetes bacterium]|nr:FecR domain-containing protein [Spirochaetota bacterium]